MPMRPIDFSREIAKTAGDTSDSSFRKRRSPAVDVGSCETIWKVTNPVAATTLSGLGLFGWFIVLLATFQIDHFELFGLKQVFVKYTDKPVGDTSFKTPFLYKLVRHPIYLGFIIAFWSTPIMTVGHLLFAAVTTAYIFVGISLEERDLIALFGDQYRQYRKQVAMLVPWSLSVKADPDSTA